MEPKLGYSYPSFLPDDDTTFLLLQATVFIRSSRLFAHGVVSILHKLILCGNREQRKTETSTKGIPPNLAVITEAKPLHPRCCMPTLKLLSHQNEQHLHGWSSIPLSLAQEGKQYHDKSVEALRTRCPQSWHLAAS